MNSHDPRPFFLNPLLIRLPLTGIVSIGHRIAGIVLFLALPLGIYLLDHSLNSPEGFAEVGAWLGGWPLRLLTLLLVWLFAHHLAAGIRVLLMDIEIGVQMTTARRSALAVILGAIAVSLFVVALS